MDIKKKKISDAQKRAQKKYDTKTKTIAIKYTPANMDEYEQLMQYLSETNQNKNKFIKNLIREFLYTVNENKNVSNVKEKRDEAKLYYPFANFDMRNIRLIEMANKYNNRIDYLEEFNNRLEIDIKNLIENKSYVFEEWLNEKKVRVHSRLKNTKGNVDDEVYYKKMANELLEYFSRM